MSSRRGKWRNLSSQVAGSQPSHPNSQAPGSQPERNQILHVVRQVILQELYQGPMPHPDMLRKYEDLYPGAAKLLFDQFKTQSDHRIELEKKVIDGNIRSGRLGQWMGYSICMTALIGGGALSCFGIKLEGIIIAVAGLVALVTVFMTGKFAGQRELKAKREPG